MDTYTRRICLFGLAILMLIAGGNMFTNWLVDKLRSEVRRNTYNLGYVRAVRRFDRNNYEKVINDLTGQFTGNPSAQLAIANSLGLPTAGIIVGGQPGGGGASETTPTGGVSFGTRPSATKPIATQPDYGGGSRLTTGTRGRSLPRDRLVLATQQPHHLPTHHYRFKGD